MFLILRPTKSLPHIATAAAMLLLALLAAPLFAQPQLPATQPADEGTALAISQPAATQPAGGLPLQLAALRAEIEALLAPQGELLRDGEPPSSARDKLIDLARQSSELSQAAPDATEQLAANQIEMRAYNALALDAAQAQRQSEASFRLGQLRNAARETERLATPDARVTGAYWLLMADLIDINRNTPNLVDRQMQATRRLETFLTAAEGSQPHDPIVIEVQLALAHLDAQIGRTARACEQLTQLQQTLGPDDPRLNPMAELAETCARLGQPVAFTAELSAGPAWSSEDRRGQVIVIHFFPGPSPIPTPDVDDLLRTTGERFADNGLTLLAVNVDNDLPAERSPPPRPFITNGRAMAQALGVRSLPAWIVIDRQGNLAATARSAAVLAAIEPMLEKPPVDAANPPPAAQELK